MRKTIIIYGLALAGLVAILKFIEYSFFAQDLTLEFYLGSIAVLFRNDNCHLISSRNNCLTYLGRRFEEKRSAAGLKGKK